MNPGPRCTTAGLSRRRRIALVTLSLVLVLLLAWLGIVWHQLSLARHSLARLRTAMPAHLNDIAPTLESLQQSVHTLDWALRPLLWAANYLEWVPSAGPLLAAAPTLWDHSTDLLGSGIALWPILEPPVTMFLTTPGTSQQAFANLAESLENHTTQLTTFSRHALALCDSVDEIEAHRIPRRIGVPLDEIQSALPVLRACAELIPYWSQLAPTTSTQTYLLLAQNSDELRATGGFLSAIGQLQMDRGVPRLGSFQDSYTIEDWNQPHPDPPEALREYMGIDLWVTRDGNWWPDFAVSAQAVGELYALNQGVPTHGMAAIDTYAAVQMLETLAPLALTDDQIIEPGGVEQAFRNSWTLPADALVNAGTLVTATYPYSAIEISFVLDARLGTAWFDSASLAYAARPNENLIQNASFETDGDSDRLPDGWIASGLAAADGLDSSLAHSGAWSMRMVGDGQIAKSLKQRINVAGQTGDAFVIAASSRADAISTSGGTYAIAITFVGESSTAEILGFPSLTHDWASAGSDKVLADWWRHRKDFIGLAFKGLLDRLSSEPSLSDLLKLAVTTSEMLAQRHIQLYAESDALQSIIERHGWGGRLLQPDADYLCVIDSNLGYNKVSPSVAQSIDYQVMLSSSEATCDLTLRYTNQSQSTVITCDKFKQYVPTYATLAQGCYWDYVRIYVPLGSVLLATDGSDVPCQTYDELERTVFDAYVTLEPGASRTLHFRYTLPSGILLDERYGLLVQKQAGTRRLPLRVTVRSNDRSPIHLSGPSPTQDSPHTITYDTDLIVDRSLIIRLQ